MSSSGRLFLYWSMYTTPNISVTDNNIIYDIILFYHIIYGVLRGFPALRKTITKHIKKFCIFSLVFDITNQWLTCHLLLAWVGKCTVKPFSIQGSLSAFS